MPAAAPGRGKLIVGLALVVSMAVEFSPEVADENSPVCFGAAAAYGGTIVFASAFGGRPRRLGIAPGWGLRGVTGGNRSACWRMR